jgi:CRP-like cAMP-binding protein
VASPEPRTIAAVRLPFPAGAHRRPAATAPVLELDPELGAGIDEAQRALAVRASGAQVLVHERGPWQLAPFPERGALGCLIVDGIVGVRVEAGERSHLELLSAGDVIDPCLGVDADLPFAAAVRTRALSEVRLALLDRGFAMRMASWPEVQAALMRRLTLRARRLSLQSAVNAQPRLDERLSLTLWLLAYRFGRVTSEGFAVHIRLTHTDLADMLAAQRPSVTLALARLEQSGALLSRSRQGWVLRGPPPESLATARQRLSAG